MDDKKRIEHFMPEIARLSNQVVDLQNERDALDAQVEAIAKDRDDWKNAMARAASVLLLHKVPTKTIDVDKALAEIRAEAVESAIKYCNLYLAFPVTKGDVAEEVLAISEIKMYAAKVRQGEQSGTWLKDSNVNGGKRQGGDK